MDLLQADSIKKKKKSYWESPVTWSWVLHEGHRTNQCKIRKMLRSDVSNNLQVNRFVWNLLCCLFSAVHELYKTNIITLQLSCVCFFLTSSEKGEDAGMYQGFHLPSCTFPSMLVHPLLPFASYHVWGLDLVKRIAWAKKYLWLMIPFAALLQNWKLWSQ